MNELAYSPSGIITILTDFGLLDTYVAIMKGVIYSRFSKATLVDITHLIAPQNIVQGAFTLGNTAPWFPSGTVHLAVVDPGVGTARRSLVALVRDQIVVAPDNGLVWPLLEASQDWHCYALTRIDLFSGPVSPTFHGRDVFAPVAAALASGAVQPRDCGPEIDPEQLRLPEPQVGEQLLEGEVVGFDHYGNIFTNICDTHLPVARGRLEIVVAGRRVDRYVRTYGEAKSGVVIALVNSFGTLEIACAQGNAKETLGINLGEPVHVHW